SHRAPARAIVGDFDRVEQAFGRPRFRGRRLVNAVADLGERRHPANAIAMAYKEQRRAWFRDLLVRLDVDAPDGLATQLVLLVDGAIAGALVRGDPTMARAAREAAGGLLIAAGGAPAPVAPARRRGRRARR